MRYDYFVAMRIPDASRVAANDLVAQITGNPADENSFVCQITDGAEVQWASQIPMREQYFQQLDAWKAQFGGDFAIMHQWLGGQWVVFSDIWTWLAQSGFTVVEVNDGTN